ncbi:hypothetical protein VPH35_082239 [Triticum aestivum]
MALFCLPDLPESLLHAADLFSSASARRPPAVAQRRDYHDTARFPPADLLSSQFSVVRVLHADLACAPPAPSHQRRHLAAVLASLQTAAAGLSILRRACLPSASPCFRDVASNIAKVSAPNVC